MKLEMENNHMKIKREKKNKNEKELIWAWMKWGFKRKMRETVAEQVRKGGGGTVGNFISPEL